MGWAEVVVPEDCAALELVVCDTVELLVEDSTDEDVACVDVAESDEVLDADLDVATGVVLSKELLVVAADVL